MKLKISLWLAIVLIVLAVFVGKMHERRLHEDQQ